MKVDVRAGSRSAMTERLDYFENLYRVPSAEMVRAFTDANGRVQETEDLREWSGLYRAVQSLERAREARSR